MTDAHARGWGDPSAKGYRGEHITAVDVAGLPKLYLRTEVAHLFMGFLQEIAARGFKFNARADDWGYAYRPIRGYEQQWAKTRDFHYLSNHSWGLALDLDATDHPLARRNTGIPRWVVDVAHKWGLSWGGDYTTRPDEMHWEYLGTPSDVHLYPIVDHPPSEEPEMTDAERHQLVTEIVDAVEARLSDTKRIPGNRMDRAVNAAERIAKKLGVPLTGAK